MSSRGAEAPRGGMGLRALAWAIGLYRRWVSGRGPLRDVRCSFAHDESCSAYGLRATAEAPTARVAVGRIVRRLHRCRDAWLLGDRASGTLSWAPLHDRGPAEIVAAMQRDGERPPAIARMLATRRAVAAWRGEPDPGGALAQLAAPEPPLMCSLPATQARSRRRIAILAALAATAAFAIAFLPWVGGAALVLAGVATTSAVHTYAERGARYQLRAAVARRWRRQRLAEAKRGGASVGAPPAAANGASRQTSAA